MKLFRDTNFWIGAYTSFVVMMLVTGWVISTGFVSKASLKTKIVYIDGKAYEVREAGVEVK